MGVLPNERKSIYELLQRVRWKSPYTTKEERSLVKTSIRKLNFTMEKKILVSAMIKRILDIGRDMNKLTGEQKIFNKNHMRSWKCHFGKEIETEYTETEE